MSARGYFCKIYGDGDIDAPEPWGPTVGAYRPSISDVTNAEAGNRQAFQSSFSIGVDPQTGEPLQSWVLVLARPRQWHDPDSGKPLPLASFALLDDNADILHVADATVRDVQSGAMDVPKTAAMLSFVESKGFDLTGLDEKSSNRVLMDRMVKEADPDISLEDIEFRD